MTVSARHDRRAESAPTADRSPVPESTGISQDHRAPSTVAALATGAGLRPGGARALHGATGNSFVQDQLRTRSPGHGGPGGGATGNGAPGGGPRERGGGGEGDDTIGEGGLALRRPGGPPAGEGAPGDANRPGGTGGGGGPGGAAGTGGADAPSGGDARGRREDGLGAGDGPGARVEGAGTEGGPMGPPQIHARGELDARETRPTDRAVADRATEPARQGAERLNAASGGLDRGGRGDHARGEGGGASRGGGRGEAAEPGGDGPAPASTPRGGTTAPAAPSRATPDLAPQNDGASVVDGRTGGLASLAPRFVPGAAELARDAVVAGPAQRSRLAAEGLAGAFLQRNASAVADLMAVAQDVPQRIAAATQSAIAALDAAIAQHRGEISSRIAAVRDGATSAAQDARAAILADHAQTLSDIQGSITEARSAATDAAGAAHTTLDTAATAQRGKVDSTYGRWDRSYRAMGPATATRATQLGVQRASTWRGQKNGESSILDGPVHDNRLEARAEAAEKVGEEYRKGLVSAGDDQATQAMAGKPADLGFIDQQVTGVGATLDTQLQQTLAALDAALLDGTSSANTARDQMCTAVESQLSGTLADLDRQEQQQLGGIDEFGSQQRAAIEESGRLAMTSVTEGATAAGASLLDALEGIAASLDGGAAPDPDTFNAALLEGQTQFDGLYDDVRARLASAGDASVSGVSEGQAQALTALSSLRDAAIGGAETTGTTFNGQLGQLSSQSTAGFGQLGAAARGNADRTRQTAVTGFENAASGVRTLFQTMDGRLEQSFTQGGDALRTGLDSTLGREGADIDKYADQAAAQVQPRWKTVLKVLLVIAVIVVVAVVAGPAVIGAVGAMAGAMGASAAAAGVIGTVVGGAIVGAGAGAVIQMGNNVIDGQNLLHDVGKAAVMGAIGGAFGGAGAALGGTVASTAARLGIGFVADAIGGVAGSVAVGDPLTVEGVLIGAGIGLAVGAAASIRGSIRARINVTPDPTVNVHPTVEPTVHPTVEPTLHPTVEPTVHPTVEPTVHAEPTVHPTGHVEPTVHPTAEPTAHPTTEPTAHPTTDPVPAGRTTPVEDRFVERYRQAHPDSPMSDNELRARFRSGDRLNENGDLHHIPAEDAVAIRRAENEELLNSPQFREDMAARGVSEERIQMMREKKCPLTFDEPEQFNQFRRELNDTLRAAGLDDAQVTMKGTSTTFYSENPKKPLGHHFDANPAELADIDLGLQSTRMVDGMNGAGMPAHPQMPHIFKTRHTVEVFPQLKEFADRWQRILGREVNFVGLTSRTPAPVDATDYVLH